MNFAPGGWKYALPPLLAAPFVLIFSVAGAIASIVAGVATLAFFRDPDRSPPPSGIVAPCDGTVSVLREENGRVRLGIFMNVWHVHVVRTPFDATVTEVEHVPGANRPAFSKDSDRNERLHVRVETETLSYGDRSANEELLGDDRLAGSDGNSSPDESIASDKDTASKTESATVTLIAGAFARRIHPYIETGDALDRGQRIGHIAFGSRVDVCFPPSIDIDDLAVEVGDSMTAGETVILEADSELPFEIDSGGVNEALSAPEDTDDTADAAS